MRELRSIVDLDDALAGGERPVVLFKHSTACPISAGALREYRALVKEHPDTALFTYLDLIAHRDVSDEIARRLGVRHESPQAIVLEKGSVRAVLSHLRIRKSALAAEITSGRQDKA